jgi:hypothetical protein
VLKTTKPITVGNVMLIATFLVKKRPIDKLQYL